MSVENQEFIQLINTAVIKTKEKSIDCSYEKRLSNICSSPVIRVLSKAINELAQEENISKDQAAIQTIEAIRELDNIWNDYVLMEGIGKLKELLRQH